MSVGSHRENERERYGREEREKQKMVKRERPMQPESNDQKVTKERDIRVLLTTVIINTNIDKLSLFLCPISYLYVCLFVCFLRVQYEVSRIQNHKVQGGK